MLLLLLLVVVMELNARVYGCWGGERHPPFSPRIEVFQRYYHHHHHHHSRYHRHHECQKRGEGVPLKGKKAA